MVIRLEPCWLDGSIDDSEEPGVKHEWFGGADLDFLELRVERVEEVIFFQREDRTWDFERK